jgi:hypothetical protein
MIASAEPVTTTDAHFEMDTSAAPGMDPELVRILESFDELKLPPLSAEVTLYLESAPGFAQASGKLARLEKDQSWGGEEGRGNLLDRIQGQLKRGSPWLKTSAERKKSKRDSPPHLQVGFWPTQSSVALRNKLDERVCRFDINNLCLCGQSSCFQRLLLNALSRLSSLAGCNFVWGLLNSTSPSWRRLLTLLTI